MASGVARAGGVLTRTGVRKETIKNIPLKQDITEQLRKQRMPTAESQSATPRNPVTLAGNRIEVKQKRTNQESETQEGEDLTDNTNYPTLIEDQQFYDEAISKRIAQLQRQLRTLASNKPVVTPKKPFSGIGFYGTLIIVAIKDIADVGIQISELFGDATVVIGIIIFVISSLLTIAVFISLNTLYMMEGVRPNNLQKKIKAFSIIAEMLPVVAILPLGTISLILIAKTEREKAKQEAAEEQAALESDWMLAQQTIMTEINELMMI